MPPFFTRRAAAHLRNTSMQNCSELPFDHEIYVNDQLLFAGTETTLKRDFELISGINFSPVNQLRAITWQEYIRLLQSQFKISLSGSRVTLIGPNKRILAEHHIQALDQLH
jgi:hypothetical protein